jgi:hypothetical protein
VERELADVLKSADYHGSCSFLLMHLYWNVSFLFLFMLQQTAETVWGKKIDKKKIIFNATVKV